MDQTTRHHPFDLSNRVALVTGSARGLGLEMAKGLAAAGALVLINGRDSSRAEAAARSIHAAGGRAETASFDLGSEAQADEALGRIVNSHGRLDILINNVGVRHRAPLDEITPADMRALLDIDLVAAYSLSKKAAAIMIPHRFGRVINLSSLSSMLGSRGDAAYITAKGGLNALTRALACEWAEHGITCNAIAPGGFRTETNRASWEHPESHAFMKRRVPLGRWGEPHEISGAAVFLASEAASFVTGTVLIVDGGCSVAY